MATIYNGKETLTNQDILYKTITPLQDSTAQLKILDHEFSIAQNIYSNNVVKILNLVKINSIPVLIMESIKGKTLKQALMERKLSPAEFLHLAIQITNGINDIHKANIIHQNMNLNNIIWNENTGECQIMDFSVANKLSDENLFHVFSSQHNELITDIGFISPEQTGRVNRAMDFRSDYYSLGVIFYFMLTGKMPFTSEDVSELVHAHLAKLPVAPITLNPNISIVLSDITMKLLSKTPEERYQSGNGILHDLKKSRSIMEENQIGTFQIGTEDTSNKFNIPDILIGRNQETKILFNALNNTLNGYKNIVFVNGSTGLGKTTFLNEILNPVHENHGLCLNFNFSFHHDTPYGPFINVLNNYIEYIINDTGKANDFSSNLKEALGSNARIISDLIPALEILIGKQDEVANLPPVESENRFIHIFQTFFKVISNYKLPFVIIFDNLHHADKDCLSLIHTILSESSYHHLLFIGSYNSDKPYNSEANTLFKFFELLNQENIEYVKINLSPLNLDQTKQFVYKLLNAQKSSKNIDSLGESVFKITNGNPLYIKELFIPKYKNNLIENANKNHDKDILNPDLIKELPASLESLVINKYKTASPFAKKIINYWSCVGPLVEISELVAITKSSKIEILNELQLFFNDWFKIENQNYVNFYFTDFLKIYYYKISESERKRMHREIGEFFKNKRSGETINSQYFYKIIYHYYQHGETIIPEAGVEIYKLYYTAGIRSKRLFAYHNSVCIFRNGSNLFTENSWISSYDFTFSFYKEWAELEYLCGNYDDAQKIMTVAKTHAKEVQHRKEMFIMVIRFYMSQMKIDKAIESGKFALKEFGIKLDKKPGQLSMIREIIISKILIGNQKTNQLKNTPCISDEKMKAVIEIMGICIPIALISSPAFAPIFILKIFNFTLKYGIAPFSPFPIATYGGILTGPLGNIKKGMEFVNLAEFLINRPETKISRAPTLFASTVMGHLNTPYSNRDKKMRSTMEICLEDGNFEYYGYTLNDYNWSSFFAGRKLDTVLTQIARYYPKLCQLKQPQITNYYNMFYQGIANLSGKSNTNTLLKGEWFDEEIIIPVLEKENDNAGNTWYKVLKMILHFLLGDHQKGLEFGNSCEKTIDGLLGLAVIQIYYFYQALLLSSVILTSQNPSKKDKKKLFRIQAKYKKWAEVNPENFMNKYLLIKAETGRIQGKSLQSISKYYEESIQLARQNELLHEEAIANELAAKFYSSLNLDNLSRVFIEKALHCYKIWGCQPKKDLMQKYYPYLHIDKLDDNTRRKNGNLLSEVSFNNLHMLDLNTILKTSYAISQEINLENTLKKLMKITAENAGAEKGYLLLPQQNKWLIEASFEAEYSNVEVLKSINLIQPEGVPLIPTTVLQHVLNTLETVVLDHAPEDLRFKDDLYIQIFKSKSILCMPLKKQGKIIAVIYLENNLLKSCFTNERIHLLEMISGHMTVSINNSLLYENLEKNVRLRTSELEIERNKLREKNNSMEKDIALARKIQYNLIPQKIPVDYISYVYKPMEALGGDFFDIIQFDDSDKIGIFVSDVSGHGVTAAFITSMIKSIIHQSGEKALNPAELLRHMNDVLEHMTSGNFITAFYGIYDPKTHNLLYSNAGHNHPYLISDYGMTMLSGGKNTAIGILSNRKITEFTSGYTNCEETLPLGSKLLIYTDGLTEAIPVNSTDSFEDQELMKSILNFKDYPAEKFTYLLYNSLVSFRGNSSFDDDICFLCVDITDTSLLQRLSRYSTDTMEIRKACLNLESLLLEWKISREDIQDIVVALDEALTNIREHGYQNERGVVIVETSKQKNLINILVKDEAPEYKLDNIDKIDKSKYIKSGKIGGFGITIIRTLMDKVIITREQNQNLLFMTKKVNIKSN